MDRTSVCGIDDGGSIPPGGTTLIFMFESGYIVQIDPWRGRIVV